MGYSDLTCDLCAAPLTGVEPCEPPIELSSGGHVLWCTFVCEGPEHHRWTVMVDSDGTAEPAAVVLVPEVRHRRVKDEVTLRSVMRTVAGLQELVLLVARIEVSLVKSVARLEQQTGLAHPADAARLRQLLQNLEPLVDDAESGTRSLRDTPE